VISETEAPLCLPPRALTRLPAIRLPFSTVDTHFHVFKPGAPLNSPRSYTPQILTLTDWQRLAAAVGIDCGVLVQPSVYGFDNSVLLEALAAAPRHLRGVVVLPPETPLDELKRLDHLGVRGVRINTRNKGGLPFDAVADFAAPLAKLGWTLQFQVRPEQLPVITALAPTLGAPVVIDHLGFIPLSTPETEDHLASLQRLLDTGHAYVKLSAPYRLTTGADHSAFAQIAARLVQSHPQRLLWATDWPHTELWADMPDDADLIDDALGWLSTDAIRRAVFVENPQSLFF
jgi:predicted TIM-barrel fold metal-dependent hydrolase